MRYDEAVTALEAAVALDSSDAAAFTDLAQARLKAGDFEGSVAAAEHSIRLNANAKGPRFVLANALRRLGRGAEAGSVLEQFRALDVVDSEIRKNLRILGNDSDDHEARAMLGLLYARQGRWAEAAEAYRHAVSLAPDSARYHNNLGNYYVRTGDLDAGIGAYQQSLTVDPQYSKAAYNLGVALVRAQRFEAAEAALERALAGDRESTDTYYHLGLLRARRADFAGAAIALEHVVAARPDDGQARHKLAVSYLKMGRVEESKEQLRRVAELEADR
jgi:Flp pilus assembly protein TadD